MRFIKYLIVLLSFLILEACVDRNDESWNAVQIDSKNYGFNGQWLDVWFKCNNTDLEEKSPVILFIHGGGWNSGDKSDWNVGIASLFSEYNILSVSINYRLVPEVDVISQLEDIDAAVNWIYENIEFYNGDRNSIFIAGHSAGAHLAALYALTYRNTFHSDYIKGIICIDGGEYLTELPVQMSVDNEYYMTLQKVFSEAVDGKDITECVPYLKIGECKYPPFLLLYQGNERYRSIPNEKLATKLISKGTSVRRLPLYGLGHMEILYSLSESEAISTQGFLEFVWSNF